jgi:hypothetical protein
MPVLARAMLHGILLQGSSYRTARIRLNPGPLKAGRVTLIRTALSTGADLRPILFPATRRKPISCNHHIGDEGEKKTNPNQKMKSKKWIIGSLLISLALPFSAATVLAADSQPSSKVTAKTSQIAWVPTTEGTSPWTTVLLSNSIKTANQKDLFIDVSLQVGLYTKTLTKSKGMTLDTSMAAATLKVKVLVDGVEAEPGEVVFAHRSQTLSAMLEGAIASCLIVDPLNPGIIILNPLCTVTPEEIGLILDTMEAASFNFVAVDVPQGVHLIEVQAQIDTTGSQQAGTFEASAFVGKGSMTVESVRLIKGEDVVVE